MKNRYWFVAMLIALLLANACTQKKQGNTKQEHSGHNVSQPAMKDMDMITLTGRDEQYANISIDTVRLKAMAEYTTLLGTTSFDERKVTVITSRIRGRLDKLFVRNPQKIVDTMNRMSSP